MRTFVLAALALALAGGAGAQAPGEAPATAPEAAPAPAENAAAALEGAPAAEAGDTGLERPPLDVEVDTGGYSYNSQGRRDPFVSLQRPVAADRGPKTRKPGMEGFLIQEVALKGIVKTAGGGMGVAAEPGFIATFLGADGKSYFVRTGQRLYDGVITAVDATSVTFRQDVTDPLSPVKSREVRKSLYASEEARQ
jgi:Tfp pilus assembly protein PilP